MKKLFFLPIAFAILLTSCCNKSCPTTATAPSDLSLNVMSYNIRYDNPDDGNDNWQYRKEFAAEHFMFYDIDVAGTQEVLNSQLQDLQKALPLYATLGVGRFDGKTEGEYAAILYKKDKLEVVKDGNFWLSEDINAVGKKGWDAACERIVTWAIFKDKSTNQQFCFVNTHFDHMGEVARRESSKLLLAKVKELSEGLPTIVTGDFNAEPESEVIQIITDKVNADCLTDSRVVSPIVYGPDGTFHNFGKIPYAERPLIDYVFLKGNIKVNRYGVLAEQHDSVFASDHHPVFVNITVSR